MYIEYIPDPHKLLVGGLKHFLFSPIAVIMIQSDFHIQDGYPLVI